MSGRLLLLLGKEESSFLKERSKELRYYERAVLKPSDSRCGRITGSEISRRPGVEARGERTVETGVVRAAPRGEKISCHFTKRATSEFITRRPVPGFPCCSFRAAA
jgi:hypothetical protein